MAFTMVTGGLENGDDKSPPGECFSCSIFILVLTNIASNLITEMTAITLIGDDESVTESDNSYMEHPQTPHKCVKQRRTIDTTYEHHCYS